MDLFTLLAKLTLDTKEYDRQVSKIASKDIDAGNAVIGANADAFDSAVDEIENTVINPPADPQLGLNKDMFDQTVTSAEETDVTDPDNPDLGLDKDSFDATVTEAEGEDIDDPASPDLGLDKTNFDSVVTEAEGEDVSDPASPDLGLDKDTFDSVVATAEAEKVDDPASPSLGLDNSGFLGEINEADKASETFGTNVTSAFEGVKKALVATGITAVVAKITEAFAAAVNTAAELGDEIDKGSIRMGISTKKYQEWNHALKQSGGSIQDMSRGMLNLRNYMMDSIGITEEERKALRDLGYSQEEVYAMYGKSRKEIYEETKARLAGVSVTEEQKAALEVLGTMQNEYAEVTGDAAEAMGRLGIKLKDSNGNLKSTEQLMDETLLALAKLTDEGKIDERDNLIDKLFGKNAGGIKPLLEAGTAEMQKLVKEADELGLVMTDDEIKNAVAYGDAVANLKEELTAIQTAFVKDIIPYLTDAVNSVTKILAFFNLRNKGTLSDLFKDEDKTMAKDLANIEGTSAAALDLIDKLFAMGDAEKLTAEQQEEWKKTAEWLIENIPGLSDVIDKDTQKITANKDEIIALIDNWQKLAREKAIANAKEAKYQAMLETNSDAIDKQAEATAKGMEMMQKRNAQIAEANRLLQTSSGLANRFQSNFGTIEITADAENLEEMLSFIGRANAFTTQDSNFNNSVFLELGTEYSKLGIEQEKLQKEAESYREQLNKAQTEYEIWLQAVDELWGTSKDDSDSAKESVDALNESINKLPNQKTIRVTVEQSEFSYNAKGNWDVPYDNYPSLLHRDEMVLTATQARQYREGNGNADLSGLEDRIIAAIRTGMENAKVNAYLNGRDVTDEVSQELAGQLAGRRFG